MISPNKTCERWHAGRDGERHCVALNNVLFTLEVRSFEVPEHQQVYKPVETIVLISLKKKNACVLHLFENVSFPACIVCGMPSYSCSLSHPEGMATLRFFLQH